MLSIYVLRLLHSQKTSRLFPKFTAIGPINIENQKIQHIFVIIDAFSRYIRLYPLESINSIETMKAFNSWIADFGCPSEIVSDNASYFVSELIKSFIDFSKIPIQFISKRSRE